MTPTALLAHSGARFATRLTVLSLFFLSAMLLTHLGVPYASPSGPFPLRIHPATYLAVGTVLLVVIARGSPGAILGRLWLDHPGVLVMTVGLGVLAFQAIAIQKLPITPLIDTFLTPILLFVALTRLPERDLRWLAGFLHVFFLINSAIGLAELFGGFRLVPIYLNGELITYETRSTALLGHPLGNAAETGVYVLLLAGPAGRGIDGRLKLMLIGFHLLAMTAFGGRTAFVLALLALLAHGAIAFAGVMLRGRITRGTVAFALMAALAGGIGVSVALERGAFDSFLGRFEEDHGSAATREAMLHVFDRLPADQVVLAPNQEAIAAAQKRLDIAIAIESFVVAFVATYGLLVTVVFLLALAAFCSELVRFSGKGVLLPIVYWFGLNIAANGIAAKSIEFSLMTIMVIVLPVALKVTARAQPAAAVTSMTLPMWSASSRR